MGKTSFSDFIKGYLSEKYGDDSKDIYAKSHLLQYIDRKTVSANRGSKSRSSFANLYAIYVIVEDYIAEGFVGKNDYGEYDGAMYTSLMKRQRELPFGEKLQNHALNNRMNSEFEKFFPLLKGVVPIIRNLETKRYWINENFLKISIGKKQYNIAPAIIDIIDEYVKCKQDSFQSFITHCQELQKIEGKDNDEIKRFIIGLLSPNVDARLFEIVSYSILKYYFWGQSIIWGYSWTELCEENLKLYKTGRTNANDGGIDFVMKPLGRFFQVTETLDFKKYFLDIAKIERYPITFVIKSLEDKDSILKTIRETAIKEYVIKEIVESYMKCIEDVINIPLLVSYFDSDIENGHLSDVLDEIVTQSKVEFNIQDEDVDDPEDIDDED